MTSDDKVHDRPLCGDVCPLVVYGDENSVSCDRDAGHVGAHRVDVYDGTAWCAVSWRDSATESQQQPTRKGADHD